MSSAARRNLGFAALVVLIALNLRAFLASTSPLLGEIQAATGLGLRGLSLLTMLPMFAMGVMALAGVSWGARIGTHAGVLGGLAAIAAACAMRLWAGSAWVLLFSAALAGVGVGLVQALMPAAIKRGYPDHTGMAMGLYSAALMGGGGLGALGAPWIAQASGQWHFGLAAWAVPAVLAALAWLTQRERSSAGEASGGHGDWRPCLRNRRAWTLVLYFGLINGGYSSLVAWLPQYFAAQGWSRASAGSMLALMTLAQLASALVVPALAHGRRDLRPWLMAMLVLQLAGFLALLFKAPMPALVIVVLGLGLGGSFALSLALALDHVPDPQQAGTLAAFMQGLGFMLAAASPWMTGWVREAFGGFDPVWIYLAAVAAMMLPLSLCFGPRGYAAAVAGLFAADAGRAQPCPG